MTTLCFIHGWGFSAEFWQPLAQALEDVPSLAVDLGHVAPPHQPALPPGPVVAVGHSLGFAWALRRRRDFAGLVAINGFARFTAAPDFPQGVPPRLLERMISRFADHPCAVYTDFMRRCGIDEPDCTGLRPDALEAGLRFLGSVDEREALADLPLLALAGGQDPILPEAMNRATFERVEIAADGGHLLPLTHTQWCAAHIRAFLGKLA
ncbi:alpha/beta fold hydrolase [Telmatospirillum sp. J64-1]|uniref:alpha/beta fold hydrolase n=1 Tax=Telmatospirillum sp. J64-1 TaxID=2502183 RepID=UPI00115EA222|nr:alpha/beta fold hydrolase [Telmatospirillum sp. J64-1]